MSTFQDGMIEFDCTDSHGASHHYAVPYKTADDRGIEISLWFLANLGSVVTGLVPVIRGAAEEWLASGKPLTVSGLLGSDEDGEADFGPLLMSLVNGLSPDLMAGVAKELRSALLAKEAKAILRDLFQGGMRDNTPILPTMPITYRGNWTELYTAAWRVIVANGFFPWPDTSTKTAG